MVALLTTVGGATRVNLLVSEERGVIGEGTNRPPRGDGIGIRDFSAMTVHSRSPQVLNAPGLPG